MLSLHINLGIPNGITETLLNRHMSSVYTLNDIITAGYSSINRIIGRKSEISVIITDLSVKQSNKTGSNPPLRLELRTSEFRNYPTYRLLTECQKLGSMLFSYIKFENNISISEEEIQLARLWIDFSNEAVEYLDTIWHTNNLVEKDRYKLRDLLIQTNLKQRCRSILSKYSHLAAKVLNE